MAAYLVRIPNHPSVLAPLGVAVTAISPTNAMRDDFVEFNRMTKAQ